MSNIIDPKLLASAAAKLERQALVQCYNAEDLTSRPSPKQLVLLRDIGKITLRFLVSANQVGKTTAGAREMAWILNDTHPWWKRPKKWGSGPLLMVIAGQSRQNIEEEIWKRKLRPLLLDKEDWKEKKNSQSVVSVSNEKNGNTILFLVHGQGSEETRAALQGYRVHYVLFDEMPKEFTTFTEIQMRTDAYDGYILVAFTPLLKNIQLKNAVENASAPYSRKYTWTVWDNPINLTAEKKKQIEQRSAMWSESERRTRLYGEWSADDNAVYHFNMDTMVTELPEHYSKLQWRHMESVDPATSSKTGYTVWAEDPKTAIWYCVKADYVHGDAERAPSKTMQAVYAKGIGYNIVRRCSDVTPWFINSAREFNLTYMQPWNKTQRKDELIKNLQEALSSGMLKITPECHLLAEELMTCRWSESGEGKIIGSQRFHLLDSAQYFWDLKPKFEGSVPIQLTRDQVIMRGWEKQLAAEAKVVKQREARAQFFMMKRRRRF